MYKAGLLATLLLAAATHASAAEHRAVRPFEKDGPAEALNPIDKIVLDALKQHGIEPANLCSDEVFVRRVYLDVIGTLPEPAEVSKFLEDTTPNKRAVLIDALLQRDEFADYWTMKWCDLLRVKAEFPINLWPNAVQAYHRWIHDSIRVNKPYDRFARELLTSSGSNFRVGPVNFYRAVQGREPSTIAEAVALTFMGVRLDHWPAERRGNLAVFFSRIQYKQTGEWKEEIVCLDPKPVDKVQATLPDGKQVTILPDQDPREVFADWLIQPDNEAFTCNVVNRVWAWLIGRGVIQEPDDIRPDNPPSIPALLPLLQKELVASHYDLKAVYRVILNSRTYQQSSLIQGDNIKAQELFAAYPVRRLDAEVLIDALCGLFGGGEGYTSAVPEPFSFIPDRQRTIDLADGSITSQFLEMFGRPSRDTGLESERNNQPTAAQRLHLLNSSHVQRRIESSPRLRQIVANNRGSRDGVVRMLYLNILSRYPTKAELEASQGYFQTKGIRPDQAVNDLAWALVNTKEFLYRH